MQQPMNYLTGEMPNIGASLMQGYALGQDIQAKRAAQARQAEMQNDLAAFAEQKNKTAADYQGMMEKYPEMSKQFSTMLDSFNAQQKEAKVNQLMSFYAPLKGGNTEAAKKQIDQLIEAYKNSGQQAEAQNMQTIRDNIDLDPQGAITSSEMFLFNAMDPERFKKLSESQELLGKERRATDMAPLEQKKMKAEIIKSGVDAGLTEKEALRTEAQTRKYDAETQKLFMEMEALKKQGPIPDEKKFDMERKLSGEYQKGISEFSKVQDAFRRIEQTENTAAGDMALIFNYMKMLDPGSTVREGEFATAEQAAGVPTRILNLYNRLLTGKRLSDSQIKDFTSQAKKLYNAAGKKENEVRSGLQKVADNYQLNADNVFTTPPAETMGEKPQQQAQPQQTGAAETAQVTATNPQTGQKIIFVNGQWLDMQTRQPLQ